MYYEIKTADTKLKNYVNRYCIINYNKNTIREISPSTNIWVYFHLSNQSNYQIIDTNDKNQIPTNESQIVERAMQKKIELKNLVIGPHRNIILENTIGESTIIGIEFKTNGNELFCNKEISQIAYNILDINQFEEILQNLSILIQNTAKENLFNQIDKYLISKYLPFQKENKKINKVLKKIQDNPFKISTTELSQMLNTCVRNFDRKIRRATGLSPKEYVIINRINKIVEIMIKNQNKSLSKIATENGYHDQTHLNRDFKLLGGQTASKVFNNIKKRLTYKPSPLGYNNLNQEIDCVNLF